MPTFYASTQASYERNRKVRVVPRILLLVADDEEGAQAAVETWLDQSYPGPAYFNCEYEIHALPEVSLEGDALLELEVVGEGFILPDPLPE